jgi:hypothetical protein
LVPFHARRGVSFDKRLMLSLKLKAGITVKLTCKIESAMFVKSFLIIITNDVLILFLL